MNNDSKRAPSPPRHPSFDRILDQLCSLDYRKRRLYLAEGLSPKFRHFQYKYMSLKNDTANDRVKYLRDIVIDSRLWLSPPIVFNDPFDMTAKVIFEGNTKEIRDKFKKIIDERIPEQWKNRRKLLDELMAKPKKHHLESATNSYQTNLENTGIFSFAGDPRSILMWSHYANNHSGVCLQFETARSPRVMLSASPLKYVNDYPIFNWAKDSGEQLKEIILTKFKKWEYEDESRIVWPQGANSYLPFDPEALTGVVLGCRTEDSDIDTVSDMLKERKKLGMPNVKIYKAHKHPSKYKLIIKEFKQQILS